MADEDQKETDEPGEPVGPLDGNFEFKKNKDGAIDKHVVICTRCRKAFSFIEAPQAQSIISKLHMC